MTLGEYLINIRKRQNLTQEALCRGLCSTTKYSRFESGQTIPDKIIIDRLLERLGKKPSKLEFVENNDEYQIDKLQEKIENAITEENNSQAETLLCNYESLHLKKSANLHKQYIYEKRAKLNYIGGNLKQTEFFALESLKCTKTDFAAPVYTALSILEFNALFYLAVIHKDGFEIMKRLNEYIDCRCLEPDNINRHNPEIKYYMAQHYHQQKKDELALAYLDSAEFFIKTYFITGNLLQILQLRKEIQGDKFNNDDIFTAMHLLKNYYQNNWFTEEVLKNWENTLNPKY